MPRSKKESIFQQETYGFQFQVQTSEPGTWNLQIIVSTSNSVIPNIYHKICQVIQLIRDLTKIPDSLGYLTIPKKVTFAESPGGCFPRGCQQSDRLDVEVLTSALMAYEAPRFG